MCRKPARDYADGGPSTVRSTTLEERLLVVQMGWCKVRDVLRECGMDVDAIALGKKPANAKIANFIAYDTDETVCNMQVLFLSRKSSTLLATPF